MNTKKLVKDCKISYLERIQYSSCGGVKNDIILELGFWILG